MSVLDEIADEVFRAPEEKTVAPKAEASASVLDEVADEVFEGKAPKPPEPGFLAKAADAVTSAVTAIPKTLATGFRSVGPAVVAPPPKPAPSVALPQVPTDEALKATGRSASVIPEPPDTPPPVPVQVAPVRPVPPPVDILKAKPPLSVAAGAAGAAPMAASRMAQAVEGEQRGVPEEFAIGAARGSAQLGASVGTGMKIAGHLTGSEGLKEYGTIVHKYWDETAKEKLAPSKAAQGDLWDEPAKLVNPNWLAASVGEMAPSLAAAFIPAGAVYTGIQGTLKAAGPALKIGSKVIELTPAVIARMAKLGASITGGAVGGALEGAGTFEEVKRRGGTDEEATKAAAMFGLASSLLNAISFGSLMSKGSVVWRGVKTGVVEAITEWLEEPTEALILGDDIIDAMKRGLNVVPGSMLTGGVLGGGTGRAADRSPIKGEEKPVTPDEALKRALDIAEARAAKPQAEPEAQEPTPPADLREFFGAQPAPAAPAEDAALKTAKDLAAEKTGGAVAPKMRLVPPPGRPMVPMPPIVGPTGRPLEATAPATPPVEGLKSAQELAAERAKGIRRPARPTPQAPPAAVPEVPAGAPPAAAAASDGRPVSGLTFKDYAEAAGKKWPLTAKDPDFARLRFEFDDLKKGLYEARPSGDGRWAVINRKTGEEVDHLPSGAKAQLEANRLNGVVTLDAWRNAQVPQAPVRMVLPERKPDLSAKPAPEVKAEPGTAAAQQQQAEAAAVEGPAPSAEPPAAAKVPTQPAGAGAVGKAHEIRVPAGSKYQIRYEAVEAEDLIPSHNPKTFSRDARYPEGVQNRPYHSDKSEQAKVIRQAQDLEPLFLVRPSPDSSGTPILAPDSNVVLSGNSRTMTLLRTLGTEGFERYRQALTEMAPALGMDPKQIEGMRNPVVVRRLVGTDTTPEFYRRFAKETNESFIQALNTQAAAVSQGKAVQPETMEWIAGAVDSLGENATLRDFLRAGRDREIIRRFIQDGVFTERDLNRYIDPKTTMLNEDGKRLVERAILGNAIPDPDLLGQAPASIVAKIERSLGALAKIKGRGEAWDLGKDLEDAVRTVVQVQASGLGGVDALRRQGSLLEEAGPTSRADTLADALLRMKPNDFKAAIGRYADEAQRDVRGQETLGFAKTMTPPEAFAAAFGEKPEAPRRVAEKAAPYGASEPPPTPFHAGGRITPEYVAWLQARARVEKDAFLADAQAVADESGAVLPEKAKKHAVKEDMQRALDKAEQRAPGWFPSDILRTTLVTRDPARDFGRIVESFKRAGYQLWVDPRTGQEDVTNRFAKTTTGYRDVALKFVRSQSDPLVKEVLVMGPAMFDTKFGEGHNLYSQRRRLEDVMKDLYTPEEISRSTGPIEAKENALYDAAFDEDTAAAGGERSISGLPSPAGTEASRSTSGLSDSTSSLRSSSASPTETQKSHSESVTPTPNLRRAESQASSDVPLTSRSAASTSASDSGFRERGSMAAPPSTSEVSTEQGLTRRQSEPPADYYDLPPVSMAEVLDAGGARGAARAAGGLMMRMLGGVRDSRPAYRPIVESREFKRWFGESQVVDEDGSPLVVYHGTSQPGFDTVDPKKLDPSALVGRGLYTTASADVAGGGGGQRGYAQKGARETVDPATVTEIVKEIRQTKRWREVVEAGLGGYLSSSERMRAQRTLALASGDAYGLSILDELRGQPFNFEREIERAAGKHMTQGAVYPLYLRIERPFNYDGFLDPEDGKRLRQAALRLTADSPRYGVGEVALASSFEDLFGPEMDTDVVAALAAIDAERMAIAARNGFGTVAEQQAAMDRWRQAKRQWQATSLHSADYQRLRQETGDAVEALKDVVPGWGRALKGPEAERYARLSDQYARLDQRLGFTGPSAKQVYEALRVYISNHQAVEGPHGRLNVNDVLKAAGYDGIQQIGGKITGGKPHQVWVAFDPEQVKSAIGNRGSFDPAQPSMVAEEGAGYGGPKVQIKRIGTLGKGLQFSLVVNGIEQPERFTVRREAEQAAAAARRGMVREEGPGYGAQAPTWFSGLSRVIDQKMPERASAEQVLAITRTPGVKPEEVKWTGLDDFIAKRLIDTELAKSRGKEPPPPFTKAEVQEFLRQNAVTIGEVNKGEIPPDAKAEIRDLENQIPKADAVMGSARHALDQALDAMGLTGTHKFNVSLDRNTAAARMLDRGEIPGRPGKKASQKAIDLARDYWDKREAAQALYRKRHLLKNPDEHKGALQDTLAQLQAEYDNIAESYNTMDPAQRERMTELRSHMDEVAGELNRIDQQGGSPRYAKYVLPGGQKYRELLLTLPKKKPPQALDMRIRDLSEWPQSPSQAKRPEDQPELDRLIDEWEGHNKAPYKSTHWDEPNVLAHIRFNDRIDADGKKTLFIEEIQSDWHQAGRRKGYADPKAAGRRAELTRRILEIERRQSDLYGDMTRRGPRLETAEAEFSRLTEERDALKDELRRLPESAGGPPDAPFKKTWHELAFKRILRHAAERGYDRVAWTTGEQQAERYDLSKQIDSITWFRNKADGTYDLAAWPDRHQRDPVLSENSIKPERIADIVGKDIADKIVGNTEVNGGTLRGVDLKVGGEGMKGFYDKILPEFAAKYGKKWGATAGEAGLVTEGEGYATTKELLAQIKPAESINRMPWVTIDSRTKKVKGQFETRDAASKALDQGVGDYLQNLLEPFTEKVHAIDITPEMRRSVLIEGQPLFEPGSVYEGKVKARKGATTADRESAQMALFDLEQAAAQPVQSVVEKPAKPKKPGRRGEDAGAGVRTVDRLIDDFKDKGFIDFRGQTLRPGRELEDLAVLAQVARDPRYETFRFFYTKGNEIVASEAVSARLPGTTGYFEGARRVEGITTDAKRTAEVNRRRLEHVKSLAAMQRRMERLGADGYYIMHNHPSGRAEASADDRQVTAYLAGAVPGLKGHVIINSGEYGVIEVSKERRLRPKIGYEETGEWVARSSVKALPGPRVKDPLLGRIHQRVDSPEELAQIGRTLKVPDNYVTLIHRDSAGKVRVVQEMPVNTFMREKEAGDHIRGQQRRFGTASVFAVFKPTMVTLAQARKLVRAGILTDAIAPGASDSESAWNYLRARGEIPVRGLPDISETRDSRTVRVQEEAAPYGSDFERLPPEIRKKLVDFGREVMQANKTDFASWAKAMREKLGEKSTGTLPGAWAALMQEQARTQAKKAEPAAKPKKGESGEIPQSAPPLDPPPGMTDPQLKLGLHKDVVDAAMDLFQAGKIERDPSMLISDQILEAIRDGKLRIEDMADILDRRGMTFSDFGTQMFRPAITDAAKRLGALGQLQRRLNELESDLKREASAPGTPGSKPGGPDPAKVKTIGDILDAARVLDPKGDKVRNRTMAAALAYWRRADNVRRGLLVTQLATSIRNFTTQVGRLGIDVMDQGLQGGLQRVFGKEVTQHPADAMRAMMDVFSKSPREQKARVDAILEGLPREDERLFSNYASDLNRAAKKQGADKAIDAGLRGAEKAVEVLNTFNRFQEYAVRRAVFQAELAARLRKRGIDLEDAIKDQKVRREIPVADIRAAIEKALEVTFASNPAYGSAGYHFVKWINQTPGATFAIPFPRFMVNALKFYLEFSPAGFLKFLSEAERQKFRQGDMKTMSRGLLGVALLSTAYLIRSMQDDDTKWNEVRLPGMDRTIDVRPLNPFAAYLFVADVLRRAANGTLYGGGLATETVKNILGVNVRGGTGLQAMDQLVDGLRDIGDTRALTKYLQGAGGHIIAGLLTPLQQLTDVYAEFDPEAQIMRDTRSQPFTGPIKQRVPSPLVEALGGDIGEEKASPTSSEPLRRESPGVRQVTGLTLGKAKNDFEKELDRLQIPYREVLPSQGDPRLDNMLAAKMGPLAEVEGERIVNSTRYQNLGEIGKRLELKSYLERLRKKAKAQAMLDREYREVAREVKAGTSKERLKEMSREERAGLR